MPVGPGDRRRRHRQDPQQALAVGAGRNGRCGELDYVNAVGAGESAPARPGRASRAWLKRALAEAAKLAEITAIVPVGHGAAGVLMAGDTPVCALDYEADAAGRDRRDAYDGLRDPFAATLSPRLAGGLNLGVQLLLAGAALSGHLAARRRASCSGRSTGPGVLSGERASEVTSLGCHTDLWRPLERRFSDLAVSRGWAERLGPLRERRRRAGAGASGAGGRARPAARLPRPLRPARQQRRAARRPRLRELADRPFSVVSTGTWFICLAAGGAGPATYDPSQDMLANVDVAGAADADRSVHGRPRVRRLDGRARWVRRPIPGCWREAAALTDWRRAPGASARHSRGARAGAADRPRAGPGRRRGADPDRGPVRCGRRLRRRAGEAAAGADRLSRRPWPMASRSARCGWRRHICG